MTWKGLLEAADDGRTYLHDSGYYGSTLNYMRGTELAELHGAEHFRRTGFRAEPS
jgi:hypothetical protein